jgi:photosystem II stability/assembly factor-like uncharacterized protein
MINGPSWSRIGGIAISGPNLLAGTYQRVFLSGDNGMSWSGVNAGLPSDYVVALEVSGTDVFAGTLNNGVFHSSDNGANWTAVNTGLTSSHINTLTISGANIFAVTVGKGIFLSTNNARSWAPMNSGLTDSSVYTLGVLGSDLYAGTQKGRVFRSTDNGASWSEADSGLSGDWVYSFAGLGKNIFAGTYRGGVFRSTNNGATWTEVNSGLTNKRVTTLAVESSMLFAGTDGSGIFRSSDNGQNWSAVNTGLTNTYISTLAVSDSNIFAGTSDGKLFRSTNNGNNWDPLNTSLTYSGVSSLVVAGEYFFAGTPTVGVFRTANKGTTWLPVNSGLMNTHINTLAASGSNLYAGTAGGGVFRSINNGTSWNDVNTGLTRTLVNALYISDANLFAGTDSGIFISTNNGANWSEINTGLKTINGTIPAIYGFTNSGINVFAGTAAGVYLSTNNGRLWSPVDSGLMTKGGELPVVCALAATGQSIIAGTRTNSGSGEIYRSTDNGSHWTLVSGSIFPGSVLSLAVNGTNQFAGGINGVFISADDGKSWSNIYSGLTANQIRALAVSETDLLAGTGSSGVWSRPWSDLLFPDIPILVSPADSSIDIPIGNLLLTWNGSVQHESFHVQLARDSTFAVIVSQSYIENNHQYLVYGLLKNTTYYWRVSASTECGTSAWSKTQSFMTIGFGSTLVTLLSPLNKSSTHAENVKFIWRKCTAPLLFYSVEMFTENYSTSAGTNDTSFTFYIPSSITAKTYSWRVRAKTDTGYGQYSDVWSITKLPVWMPDSGSAANPIELVFPANGGKVGGGDSVEFIWRKSSAPAASYVLELWDDYLYSIQISDTTVKIAVTRNNEMRHFWRVRSSIDTGSYSGLWSFTMPLTVAPRNEQRPTEFILYNNYPNPFNPSTTISFDIPIRSFVTLKVLDALGREVSVIASEILSAGTYMRQWNAADFPSGVYFYRLQAGAYTETKRLVLLK